MNFNRPLLDNANEQQAIDFIQQADPEAVDITFGPNAEDVRLYAKHAAEVHNNATPAPRKGDSLIVLLPGLTGSTLVDTRRDAVLWLNPLTFVQGRLNDLDLAPDGLTDANPAVNIEAAAPMWPAYAKMILRLRARYDLAVMPFDWRKSVTETAKRLPAFIDQALEGSQFEQVTLVGHSMGGLVAFDYLTLPQYRKHATAKVKRCITLGAPFKGTLEAMGALANPDDPKFRIAARINSDNDPHRMLLTFPGLYELLPAPNNLYVDYQPAPNIDVYDPEAWFRVGCAITPDHLAAARRRHVRVAQAESPVRLINVIGSYYNTRGEFEGDHISITDFMQDAILMRGDGTVDARSAIHGESEAYYLQEDHIELALDSDIIASIMSWSEGGAAVGLKDDIEKVMLNDAKLRDARAKHEVDASVMAQKIQDDQPLTHAELMALMTPFSPQNLEAAGD